MEYAPVLYTVNHIRGSGKTLMHAYPRLHRGLIVVNPFRVGYFITCKFSIFINP